ncbi:hypothetical protein, partial [Microcystis aeruginosa]|uniref:hypothetical protein n=1 Tax=Microcystis aeruginosa TaxID=1126 RepID=UPI001C8A5323
QFIPGKQEGYATTTESLPIFLVPREFVAKCLPLTPRSGKTHSAVNYRFLEVRVNFLQNFMINFA